MRTILLMLALAAAAAPSSQWEQQMAAQARAIREKYHSGKKPGLAKRLAAMKAEDQRIRRQWLKARGKPAEAALAEQMAETDRKLTGDLKILVAQYGWPTFELVGYSGATAAGLILIHSPDHDFQRKMLPELAKLVEKGQVLGEQVALVTDKLLVSDGKPQRFGTQFSLRDGKAAMDPVEDPEHLEERRAKYGLMPMAEYKRQLGRMYKSAVE